MNIDQLVHEEMVKDAANGRRFWNEAEDTFIRQNLGWMTDAEMAEALGRSEVAVHLRWDRDLGLPGPSKAPDVITAHKAAEALGIDEHKIAHWTDMGLIPGRIMAGGRKIRLIQRETFRRWVLNPMNWMYFDIHLVQDEELKRLLVKRAQRWGDEWWPTEKVAEYHGVDTGDIKRYIQLGRIRAFQPPYSLGGRHPHGGWSRWFVLKSEATRKDIKFLRRGENVRLTKRGAEWIRKALKMGWSAEKIGRSMDRNGFTVSIWIKRFGLDGKRIPCTCSQDDGLHEWTCAISKWKRDVKCLAG
jgi:hypothetical protein